MKKTYMAMATAVAIVISGCASNTSKTFKSVPKDYMCKMVAVYKNHKPTYLYTTEYDQKITVYPMHKVLTHGKHPVNFMYLSSTKHGDIYTKHTARAIVLKGSGELAIMEIYDVDTRKEQSFLFKCRK